MVQPATFEFRLEDADPVLVDWPVPATEDSGSRATPPTNWEGYPVEVLNLILDP
jgi:hypothetical protein